MTTKQKPAWRMNTGTGVPSDLGDRVMYSEGWVGDPLNSALFYDTSWCLDGKCSREIYAYQTTRTKAAKYERVECDCDEGTIHLKGGYHTKCGLCNGKGYTLEKVK